MKGIRGGWRDESEEERVIIHGTHFYNPVT